MLLVLFHIHPASDHPAPPAPHPAFSASPAHPDLLALLDATATLTCPACLAPLPAHPSPPPPPHATPERVKWEM